MKEMLSELDNLVKHIKQIQMDRNKLVKNNVVLNNKIKKLMTQQKLFLKKIDSISNLL